MIAASGGAAAAAAAEMLRRREEEEMTSYSPKDLADDWEFKILRSQTGVFRNPEKLRAVLDEEKRGGWVLVEKFDNQRIRLKRPAGTKVVEDDLAPHPYDPYRTELGLAPGIMVGIAIAFLFAAVCITLLLARQAQEPMEPAIRAPVLAPPAAEALRPPNP